MRFAHARVKVTVLRTRKNAKKYNQRKYLNFSRQPYKSMYEERKAFNKECLRLSYFCVPCLVLTPNIKSSTPCLFTSDMVIC